jgi:hypothetical protein
VADATLSIEQKMWLQQCLNNDILAGVEFWCKSSPAGISAFLSERAATYCGIITKPEPVYSFMS